MDSIDWEKVKSELARGKTYEELAIAFDVNVNTFIARCRALHITKRSLANSYRRAAIASSVKEVGRSYGRRMMTGYLASRGIRCSEQQTLRHLEAVDTAGLEERKNKVRVTNPIPYSASRYGEKLHIDQNEKLIMFGVFHAACIDGYSGRIVAHIIIPQKNNMLLYDMLYCQIVRQEGIWDSLRTDYGTEWNLILFVQNILQECRMERSRPPFAQTFSKRNLRIERWWVEVNKRVNYPIKAILCRLQQGDELPASNENETFIVGEFIRRVCRTGVSRLVASWNNHHICGKGTPGRLVQPVGTVPLELLPSADDAALQYEHVGGSITRPGRLNSIEDLLLREVRDTHFEAAVGSFDTIYQMVMADDSEAFSNALTEYVRMSKNYQPCGDDER